MKATEPHVVVTNTEKDLARKRAAARVEFAFRDLFANMLRLSRSNQGGAMHLIVAQLCDAYLSVTEYREIEGFTPVQEIRDGLDPSKDAWWRNYREGENRLSRHPEVWAMESILKGAAQIMASRLLGQLTQEQRGESELSDGMRALRKAYGIDG